MVLKKGRLVTGAVVLGAVVLFLATFACGGKTALSSGRGEAAAGSAGIGGQTASGTGGSSASGATSTGGTTAPGAPGTGGTTGPGRPPSSTGGGTAPGEPGVPVEPTPVDPLPPELAEELCANICSLVAHPCNGSQSLEACWDQCFALVERARDCPAGMDLLRCYEAASFEIDPCQTDVDDFITVECSDAMREVLRTCPDVLPTDPSSPPPPSGSVICAGGGGTVGDNFCATEAFECSDGNSYAVECSLRSGQVSCQCFSDFIAGVTSFTVEPLFDFQRFCVEEAFASCGFPAVF